MTHAVRSGVAAATVAATLAVIAGLGGTPTQAATTPRITVGVFDNYYAPIPKKAIKRGTLVRWRWDASTLDVHDVALKKAPSGVKRFGSDPLASGQSFSRKLTVPGTYYFVCTFHEDMTMTLRVAKS